MFEGILKFFKKIMKSEVQETSSKDTAKERLHLVLMQDRANVSADFLELMKQEIIDVIKKYIEVDENAIDVRLTNKSNEDGENGAPALYANIPIINIRNDMKKINPETGKVDEEKQETVKEEKQEEKSENVQTEQEVEDEQEKTEQTEEITNDKQENTEEKNENEESTNP